jgi:hypothetical protein
MSRHAGVCLWLISRVFVAFGLLWVGRRLARWIDDRESRAIDECRAIAPLVLFTLYWLLVDSAQPSAWAKLP